MTLSDVAYLPYGDPDDFIREVTDRIWVRRDIDYIRENYEPDSIVHGGLGTAVGRDPVVAGTLMRIADTPNRVGQAEDVVWEPRGEDAFLSSHQILNTDLIDLEYRGRGIANCLYRRGRMVEEWLVRDTAAAARQRGRDADELARQSVFRGFTGSIAEAPPEDVLAAGVSGPRPDDHRAEAQLVLELIADVWNRRNLSRVDELFDRDLVLNTVDDRTITRPEGYRRALLRLLAPFPEARFDVYDIVTNEAVRYGGVRVAVTWMLRGQHNGAVAGYGPLSGAAVEMLGSSQFLLHGGRLVRETKIYDDIAVRAQISAARGDEPFRSSNIY